jgi:tellurite resistance protein TerC
MEWSLSIDNIFIFVLIFSSFNVRKIHTPGALIRILMAALFRTVYYDWGYLVSRFHWILYIFGLFLVYTGYKMFTAAMIRNLIPTILKSTG